MKKVLLLAAASAMVMAASAQTVIAPPTVDAAKAAGYEGLWGDYQYGYVMPNGTTLVDDDNIKVVVDNGSTDKPGANVALSSLNTTLFGSGFYMGSAASAGYFESVYSLQALSNGIKQPYAIFNVNAKVGGELTMYFNRGKNKATMYVWDITVGDGVGTYVLASTVQTGVADLVSEATVGLTAEHNYWIFVDGTGSNTLMYEMVYTPYTSESYSAKGFDTSKFSTSVLPPTVDEAKEKGYEALWGDYQYGYVIPNETALVDNDEIKVVVDNGSTDKPGANVALSSLNTTAFNSGFYMGSAASSGYFESVYSLQALSNGIKQPYAIFTVDAKVGGELTMYFNRGKNKATLYVWDTTIGDGVGAYVLASTVQTGVADLVSKAVVGLTAEHKYWIFVDGTGSNTLMYGMGFNSYTSPNYGYTGEEGGDSSAITDIIVDQQSNSNVIYNVLGQKVDESYKGIVIKNGKKYIQR
ncbi:MAG: hypothetical protein K2G41_08770 [Duncaniella sp.]|uniref:hypothetical protein n=1 Tax=Duncaniella sp. TaxID=2518496 RepID=UPI0023C5B6E4|nr:hypothetical protein [Duncaniella sp.]MDE6090780.1 hypothetical protein [Duncaniella sp.]